MKNVLLFSDGSSLGNPGAGGWCAILRYGEHERILSGGEAHTTNNRMELKGVIEGLKVLKEPCQVTIISDSQYVLKGLSEWIQGWIKKQFKGVKNPDLWEEYLQVSQPHHIHVQWVRGHNGHPENEKCDEIAKKEAEKFR